MSAPPLPAKPINVVQVITGLGSGGAERQLATLVLNSDPNQVRHTVVSLLDEGVWGGVLRARGIPVHCLSLANKLAAPLILPKLAKVIREAQADIVQTWLYHADLAGLAAAKIAGRPVLWALRGSRLPRGVSGWEQQALVRVLAKMSSAPRAVIANSNDAQRWHNSIGYRPRRWSVIPNGIDCDQFRPDPQARIDVRRELGLPDDAILVGNLSRLDPLKDHPTLLAAFARLPEGVRLLLAGDGIESGNPLLSVQIAAAGVDPARVLRLGRRSDVARLQAALDLAVLSSISESFPNVVAEAMACGVPAVGTAVGDMALILGDVGMVVPPRDPVALGAAMNRILDLDPPARAELSRRARARIESMFSVPAMVSAYRQLYEDILTPPPGSRN
ncbi:MAG TPA: glycosyltransferase [Magnetospirillaceae bacterium]|jgi:glycosyltransferase involved in cell wall biosynthesis